MSLKDRIRRDRVLRMVEKYLKFTDMDLVVKFRLVNRSLFAINLGLCGLTPEITYDVLKLERVGRRRIVIYYSSKLYPGREIPYLLPERYADTVSDRDIELINTGVEKYRLIRTIKKCDETRVQYDHKNYTWDLEVIPVF